MTAVTWKICLLKLWVHDFDRTTEASFELEPKLQLYMNLVFSFKNLIFQVVEVLKLKQ
ncbi:hypothetical protein Lepto7375DRAFT_1573 [Leptolyngbya sp. PCC 7375]|nr:hypothetical protein Lepto7375DRAFT_1573 [Leptolyngbya sp. PCC 7375]